MADDMINDRKCYNCGKIFRTPSDLNKHKARKTPCLIREVDPKNIDNPNRCIYCNKVFAQPQTLTRHLKTCKIKNGGMEILVDKVRHEQELRILKEKDAIRDKQLMEMKEEMQQMKERDIARELQMKELKEQLKAPAPQQIINNLTNTVNTTINNPVIININSYRAPDMKGFYTSHKRKYSHASVSLGC